VYNELPNVAAYSKIKIELYQNYRLIIPAQVVIQGKTIEAAILIDTGFNGFLSLSANYIERQGIDMTNAYYGKSTVSGGFRPGFSIPADTIKIGDLYIANQNIKFMYTSHSALKNAIRLLIGTLNKNYGHISAEFVKHWNVIPFVLGDTTTIYIFVVYYQGK